MHEPIANNARWMADALCAQVDLNLHHPEQGETNAAAKRVCARCPVKPQCLDYALERPELGGIWAGTSEHERQKLRNGRIPGGCKVCGKPVFTSGTRRYCDDDCRRVAKNRREAAKRRAA